jgi:hypothetical protein
MIIRIVLKSGYAQDFYCTRFVVNKEDRQLASLDHDIEPRPFWLDLREIAMIFPLEAQETPYRSPLDRAVDSGSYNGP